MLADEQSDVQSNVEALGKYVTELRGYMKRFPWTSCDSTSDTSAPLQGAKSDDWEQLSTEVTFQLAFYLL